MSWYWIASIVVGSLAFYIVSTAVAMALFDHYSGALDDLEPVASIFWPITLLLFGPIWILAKLWGKANSKTTEHLKKRKASKIPTARVHRKYDGQ